MNKKLIALSVAGACVAPAAMAQTANPVTLYGRVYVTLESVEAKSNGTTAEVARRTRVADQSSYLGVRGTEDIGGGMKVFFQLETGFKPDQNDTTFAARNSGVGLQGGWGSLLAGRWDSPFKVATTAIDPFGDLTIGGTTGVINDAGNFDRRPQNVLQYWSPNWAGFTFRLERTANEGKTATANPYDQGAAVAYTGGPVYAFIAYEEHKDQLGATVTPGIKEKGSAAGAAVTFGPVKVGGLYEEIKKTDRSKQKAWMGNVVFTFGNNQLIYQYMQNKDGGLSNPATPTTQPDCDSSTLGYQYNFSRRTFFLAQYTKVDNNDTSSCNFGANRLAAAAGQDVQGVSVGLRHIF